MIRSLTLFAALLASATLPAQIDADGPAISPFRGMRKVEDGIEVQVLDDTWYGLASVAGVDTATLQKEALRLCRPGNDWKRITEDLPAFLAAMGTPVGERVDVIVRDLATGKKQTFEAVAMTHENRQRVKSAQRGDERRPALPMLGQVFAERALVSAADVRADLQVLRQLLETRFAYRELRGVDLDGLLDEVASKCNEHGMTLADLRGAVDQVLRTFGDGHSRIRDAVSSNALWTPFLISQCAGGHVAFLADRSQLVDAQHPFVVAMDGVPLAKWLDAARQRVTQGSEVMQAGQAERGLRELSNLRRALQLPEKENVVLTLRGATGEITVSRKVVAQKPMFGLWPRRDTGILAGNIGYLRIATMSGEATFLDGLDAAMQNFRETEGLVIDVRSNGGGTRDALRRLAPYFLPVDGTPVVGNVASVLLEEEKPAKPDELADRYLYRADWAGWTDRQRTAIAQLLRGFQPSWKLPSGKFSPWHFLVLDRDQNPAAYHYNHRVVVLIDRGCFSATDIFAAAMQAIPGVTLLGESTAGGSGRARSYQLPNSGIRLQLSTMASFRPDGVLLEGNGVVPDLRIEPQPTDLIGEADTALHKALELLR
jgi:hypothetical protein